MLKEKSVVRNPRWADISFSKGRILITTALCALLLSTSTQSQEYVPYFNDSDNKSLIAPDINPGLYPPLSSGEASPWQEELPDSEPAPVLPQENPWAAQSGAGVMQNYAAPMTVVPSYPYQVQPGQQTYPLQPGQYTYPTNPYAYYGTSPYYGASPFYVPGLVPPMPYGYGVPYGGVPYGGVPGYFPGNFNNGGFNPFNFSMPWPF